MTDTTPLPCPWKLGDKVQRKPGASYLFPGVIISTGLKLDGKTWHCEVECIAPGVEGCTHVFPASQLVPLDPAWNTRANADARLVEMLREAEWTMRLAHERMAKFAKADVGIHGGACPRYGEQELRNSLAKVRAALSEVSQ